MQRLAGRIQQINFEILCCEMTFSPCPIIRSVHPRAYFMPGTHDSHIVIDIGWIGQVERTQAYYVTSNNVIM